MDGPGDITLDDDRIAELLDHARREVEDGTLPACQLAMAHGGRVVAFETVGDTSSAATDRGEAPRFAIFSVTKALMAGALWILLGEGLEPATRVAELVPGFADNGKETVTVDHLLLHTAGFPRAPMRPEEGADPDARRARFAQWRLDWEPGTRYEYHPISAHWVLAEIVEQITGIDFRRFVADRVTGPLGLERLQLGVPPEDQRHLVDVMPVGDPITAEEMERRYGVSGLVGGVGELAPQAVRRSNEPVARAAGSPGSGAFGTAADVAMYLQAMLVDGDNIWDPGILRDGTGEIRVTYPDPFTGAPANRTRGLVVAGGDGTAPMRGFAREAGPRTFGSPGIGGQVAWADPDTGVSFCYLTNGMDADLVRAGIRGVSVSGRAAACVLR
jgi:CubicO group peptidase (beta-lactamase class C family)